MNLDAFIRLTRIEHAIMLCAAVLIGEAIVLGQLPTWEFALLTFFPPFFIEISAFTINDYFDVGTDRANKRMDRPLVSGEATPKEALLISIASLIIGVAAAWLINPVCFIIALVFGAVSFAYSYKLKDTAFFGNLYIGLTMAVPFFFGNFAVSGALNGSVGVVALIAFVVGLGREIIGTVRDMEGDRQARGAQTLPMLLGKQLSLLFASILLFMAILLTAVPLLSNSPFKNDMNYAVPIAIADILLLYVVLRVVFNSQEFMLQARLITLAALGIGLAGFLAGALR